MEDEIYVRIIGYKLDCKNCKIFADSGQFQFKGNRLSAEHIGSKYIDQASFSIGNSILKILGYLPPVDKPRGFGKRNQREMQEMHEPALCGACKFGDCVWMKEAEKKGRN